MNSAKIQDRRRFARTVGLVLLIAAPALAYGSWQSSQQPLEVLALAERMKATLPADQYASAVYHASAAQLNLDRMWSPTGFATLGVAGFLAGVVLLYLGLRSPRGLEAEASR